MVADRSAWLEERRKGIGGSDVAAVIGINPWRTSLDVYSDKLGLVEQKEISEAAHFGIQLEQIVAQEFQSRTGKKVQKVNYTFHDSENEWMIANIDRAIINPDICKLVKPCITDKEKKKFKGRPLTTDIAFEAKTANQYFASDWGPSQEQEIKAGKIISEHVIPLYYETQVQWYCGILKLRGMYLGVLIGGQDYRMYWIPARPDVFEVLKAKCSEFWHENVLKKVPPAPTNIEDVLKLYSKSNGQEVEAKGDLALNYGELSRLDRQIKELTKQKNKVKEKVALDMKDNEVLTLAGNKVLTYRTQTIKRFDIEEFKEDYRDLYHQYLKETTTRVMRLCA